jgi:sugar/nucleoside kinase (ribokinase family)
MRRSPEIIATGGIIIDNIVTAGGDVHRATLGGNAVYAAAGAHLWSRSAGLVGITPADYPELWLHRVAAAGIDTSGVVSSSETGLASEWFFHRADGGRVDHLHGDADVFEAFGLHGSHIQPEEARNFEDYLARTAPRGETFKSFRARHPVTPDTIPETFRIAKALHCAPNEHRAQRALVETARRSGWIVSLDPGFAAADLATDLDGLLPLLDAFLPSEKELAILAPGLDPERAVRSLLQRGAKIVVAKLGARGALVASAHGLDRIPIVPVEAIDPTGAGDAFCGGFLAGYLRTGDAVAAACCGAVAASFAVEDFGCLTLLSAAPKEAADRLHSLAAGLPPSTRHAIAALTARNEAHSHA